MKRKVGWAVSVMVLAAALVLAGCDGGTTTRIIDGGALTPGWHTGTADSYFGVPFEVRIHVSSNAIMEIQHDAVAPTHYTATMGSHALPVMIDRVLRHQTIEVDVVAGNTATSAGFLLGLEEALVAAAAPRRFFQASVGSRQTHNVDVLVVGSGMAGIAAAHTAATTRSDATVLLIEQQSILGGTTRFAANFVKGPRGGAGNQDNPTGFVNYIMMRSRGLADQTVVQAWADNVAPAVLSITGNALAAPGGFAAITGTAPSPGWTRTIANLSTSTISGVTREGSLVWTRARALDNFNYWTNVQALDLIVNASGEVTGVIARDLHNQGDFAINVTGGVILATGGFDNNADLMRRFNRDSQFDQGHGIPGCGTGIEMGMRIGADTVFMGGKIGMVARDNRRAFPAGLGVGQQFDQQTVAISRSGAVFRGSATNAGAVPVIPTFPTRAAAGQRGDAGAPAYPAETGTPAANSAGFTPTTLRNAVYFDGRAGDYAVFHRWMLDQRWEHARGAGTLWYIGGQPIYDPNYSFWIPARGGAAPTSVEIANDWRFQVAHNAEAVAEGITHAEHPLRLLAPMVGMTPENLYNAWRYSGVSMAATTAWALTRIAPVSMGSMGGLRITPEAEVTRNGTPIPGLFAAGDAANGQFYYLEYTGSGSGLAIALTFGYLAGKSAADRVPGQ